MAGINIDYTSDNSNAIRSIDEISSRFEELYASIKKMDISKELGNEMAGVANSVGQSISSIKTLFGAIKEQGDSAKDLISEMHTGIEELIQSYEKLGDTDTASELKALLGSLDSLTEEVGENQEAVEEAVDSYNELAESQRDVENVTDDMVDALKGSYDLILGKTQNLEGTIKKVYKAYSGFQELMKNHGVDIANAATKMSLLQKASLSLGKALVRAGLSANAARIALQSLSTIPVVAAITAIIIVLRKLVKEHQAVKQAAEEARLAQEEFHHEVSKGASSSVALFYELSSKWRTLSSDMERNQFLKENQKAFDELGISINSLNEAQNVLVSNADTYIASQIKMAQADIYRAKAKAQIEELLYLQQKLESTPEGKKVWVEEDVSSSDDMRPDAFRKVKKKISEREALQKEIEAKTKEIKESEENVIKLTQEGVILMDHGGEYGVWPSAKSPAQAETKSAKIKADYDKETKEREQAEMRLSESLSKMMSANEQARLELFDEGTAKEILRIKQRYSEKRKELDKQEEDWIELNKKVGIEGLTKEQSAALTEARKNSANAEAKEILDIQERNQLEYLKSYGTYEEKRFAITQEYAKKIAATDDEYEKKALEKRQKEELGALEDQYSEFFKKLAKERSEWLVGDTVELLKMAEESLAKLGDETVADENTVERIQRLKEEIRNLKGELSEAFTPSGILKQLLSPDKEGGGKSFAERIQALRDAWVAMTSEQKWKTVGGYVAKIGTGLMKAASSMREIAELTGDSGLASSAEQLDALAQNFSAAGEGAAQGGWIGAIIGGGVNIIEQTYEAIAETAKQEKIAEMNAHDWAQAIEELNIKVNKSEFSSIFGDKKIEYGIAKYREASDTLALYEKRIKELNDEYNNQNIKETQNVSTGAAIFSGILPALQLKKTTNEYKTYQDALNKGYSGLQNMLVKTRARSGWAKLWGAQDKYTALGDLAPELWKDGEFNVEAAKEFLSVNTQISKEQRKQIQNLIDLKTGYDEALKAVDETVSEYFGSIAQNLTDIIWDSVMTGADAWQGFQEAGAEAISAIGKSLIQEMLISEYLEQYRDQLREAYAAGNMEETQAQLRDIVSDIFNGMEEAFAAGSAVAEEYQAWANRNGFDLTGASSATTATNGSFQTISEATGRALEGRFAALQISNDVIATQVTLIGSLMQSMSMLSNDNNGYLSDIRSFHLLESGYLEDIARQTKPLLAMSGTLEEIRKNTQNL